MAYPKVTLTLCFRCSTPPLEFDLWRRVIKGPFLYGQLDLTVDHIERLQRLSEACGGWVAFDGGKEEAFVPIDNWTNVYRDHTRP